MGKNRTESNVRGTGTAKVAVAGPHSKETPKQHHTTLFNVEPPRTEKERQAENNMEKMY